MPCEPGMLSLASGAGSLRLSVNHVSALLDSPTLGMTHRPLVTSKKSATSYR